MDELATYVVTGFCATFFRGPTYVMAYRNEVISMEGVARETRMHLEGLGLITPVDPDLGVPQ